MNEYAYGMHNYSMKNEEEKIMKKLVALALGTVMAVSMTAGVSAATVEL